MRESNFIAELEKRAAVQKKLAHTAVIPDWAKGIGDWLATNPWRVVIPIASIGYSVCRIAYGVQFRELILGLFGGFVR